MSQYGFSTPRRAAVRRGRRQGHRGPQGRGLRRAHRDRRQGHPKAKLGAEHRRYRQPRAAHDGQRPPVRTARSRAVRRITACCTNSRPKAARLRLLPMRSSDGIRQRVAAATDDPSGFARATSRELRAAEPRAGRRARGRGDARDRRDAARHRCRPPQRAAHPQRADSSAARRHHRGGALVRGPARFHGAVREAAERAPARDAQRVFRTGRAGRTPRGGEILRFMGERC